MSTESKLKQAENRVRRIRNFYNHLQVFVIVMLVFLLFSNTIIEFFESHIDNPNWLKWLRANIWINVLIWFIVVAFQGLLAFKYKIGFIENWEQKKVQEFMNEKE